MPLENSLSTCLEEIKSDWLKNNHLALISKDWPRLVGEKLASNCTPLSLKKGILTIGASHPQWRQAVFYTRNEILESLISSGHKIKDIKIQQYHPQKRKILETQKEIWNNHPSRIDIHGLKDCEECKKPAPIGEINRWGKCGFCRRKNLLNQSQPK